MGEKLVRIRQPGRNDDAARPVDPEKERAPRWWSEFCSPGFPSPTQDACGPHGGNEHTRRAIASDGVHSPRQCGPAGLVGNFRSNAPLHRSARDSRRRCGPGIMFRDRRVPGTSNPYFASRSKMRYLGADPNGNASRNCWMIQPLVGCFVTLAFRMRRRSWLMTKKQ